MEVYMTDEKPPDQEDTLYTNISPFSAVGHQDSTVGRFLAHFPIIPFGNLTLSARCLPLIRTTRKGSARLI